jgi:outer membrane murein-binding lipoprotein Lpp
MWITCGNRSACHLAIEGPIAGRAPPRGVERLCVESRTTVHYLLTNVKLTIKWLIMEIFSWVNTGLLVALSVSFLALAAALRAAARLGQLISAVKDLDWDSLADLSTDVQKLKKQVQRYRNDENAQAKALHKQALHQIADQIPYDVQQNVTNIKRGG